MALSFPKNQREDLYVNEEVPETPEAQSAKESTPLADDFGGSIKENPKQSIISNMIEKRSSDLDPKAARQGIELYRDRLEDLEKQADRVVVKDDTSAETATEMIAQVKTLFKDIESVRKQIIEKPDKFVRSVNAFAKKFKDQIAGIEGGLKRKVGDYSYQKELKRREAERKAREEAERKQKEMDEAAKKAGVDTVKLPEQVVPKDKGPVRSDSGVASTRMVKKHRIVDEAKVPRMYLMVNERAIRDAINGGIAEIPGVEIYEEAEVRVRTY